MYKMVILVRSDLGMSCGKVAAQVAHAALGAYKKSPSLLRKLWEMEGEKKVVLSVDSLDKMIEIKKEAEKRKMKTHLVRDAGHTEVPPGTVTALAIGPEKEDRIDSITGELKLL